MSDQCGLLINPTTIKQKMLSSNQTLHTFNHIRSFFEVMAHLSQNETSYEDGQSKGCCVRDILHSFQWPIGMVSSLSILNGIFGSKN